MLKKQADEDAGIGRYTAALDVYARLIKKHPKNSELLLGRAEVYADMLDWPSRLSDLQQVYDMGPAARSPGLLLEIGKTYYELDELELARTRLEEYLATDTRAQRSRATAEKLLSNIDFLQNKASNHNQVKLTSLGENVNTAELEYLPSINAEEDMLVFTRRSQGQEDLYLSRKQADGTWGIALPLSDINTAENESGHCLSADGKTIIFTKCDQETSYGSCDLYITELRTDGWSVPMNLGSTINTQAWEGQPSLSANGKFLIFSSSRAGGQGGRDLWISKRLDVDQWTAPVNLGSEVNGVGNEGTPFLHPDGLSLYFRADGRSGYGGYDLYMTRLGQEGWSEAINLGSPINTKRDEGSLIVNLRGDRAYFASERLKADAVNARGDIDLFSFEMPAVIRPQSVTFVKLLVLDRKTRELIDAAVDLHAYADRDAFLSTRTGLDGEILVCLPLGDDYAMSISAEGYRDYSRAFSLAEVREESDAYILTVELEEYDDILIEPDPIILENVRFRSGSTDLLEASFLELDGVVRLMEARDDIRIEILGHTDDVGDDQDNLLLSQNRAQSVADYLISRGISSSRLSAIGYGESRPIAENTTEEGRAQNRRVEFRVLD